MTRISDRCKTAREKATPGPWRVAHGLGDDADVWIESSGDTFPDGEPRQIYETTFFDNWEDLNLAALAPEAADEVIRLHQAFETLAVALDGNGYDLSEIAADIRRILNPNGAADDVDCP